MATVSKVIASPGMQALVDIAGQRLLIDCYTPVDLTEKFSDDEITSSKGLAENLHQGFLVEYTGQDLPVNPNAQVISELRHNQDQHIQVMYTQATSVGSPVVTDPKQITTEFSQELVDKVAQNKAKILLDDSTLVDKVSNAYDDVDKDPVERRTALTPDEMTMRVSMDIPPSEFAKAQAASAVKANALRAATNPVPPASTPAETPAETPNIDNTK